ncbi:hypothetical protein FB45DRAFT_1063233 [Roridomyces roridus]|uniref:Uncharacterized protein n=1 Tax=Roridomyces roridus TaxID=1738132 RepID=A0AAD7BES9_9AGAR|nr:hypothetical protein FB45DRAFT_1063233 [Roridomyces roridus]
MHSGKRARRPANDQMPATDKTFSELLVSAGLATDRVLLAKEVAGKLRIPDCKTTRGLKKCHGSFETVSAALDNVYTQSREYSGSQVAAADNLALAILSIYSDIGEDTILRKRIVSETRFLERSVALLASPWAREAAVRLLSRLSHQHSTEVLPTVARFTSSILDCAEPHLTELPFVEKAVCVLSHAVTSAIHAATPNPKVVAALPRVLKFMLSVVLLPASTSTSFDHFIAFCHQNAPQYPAPFFSNPDSIDFLVACARSPDIGTRICSQRALIDACAQLADSQKIEPPLEFAARARIFERLHPYSRGAESSFSTFLQRTKKLEALVNEWKTNLNCSHLKLGKELAGLILHYETTIRACIQPGAAGAQEFLRMLRVCEAAVRNAADETNKLEVTADILRLQRLTSEGDVCPCVYAQEALKRNPSAPFFHYILANFACGRDESITLVVYANKGLQCVDGMTDYMQQQLLYLTVSHSLRVVSRMAQGLPSSENLRLKEIDALTKTALANARIFLRVAPLDHQLMPSMTAFGTHIHLLRNGHMWKDETFQSNGKFFAHVREITRCSPLGVPPSKDCHAFDKILERMSSAWDTWGPAISRQPKRDYKAAASNSDVDTLHSLTS